MKLQKFVVLIVVLVMLAGLTVYVALDSDIFVKEDIKVINDNSNTINNK